ncbi:hypothetical protein KIH41_12590 [Litoribacter ruber]|uniref:hypothetical protein n=1 Tax=Litoribacter ruber TaxID=702568 RepID=UPI001BD9E36E|nr:hypothetical protein [Litoribacter ruber]MBT0812114.1 hypothetical protein [Litoribacter ruber]
MKKLILASLTILLLAACQNDDNPNMPLTEIGDWELEQVTLPGSGEVISATDLGFSQTYTFKTDGTFSKFSTETGVNLSGTYEAEDAEPDDRFEPLTVKWLTLTFDLDQYEAILAMEDSMSGTDVDKYIFGSDNMEVIALRVDHTLMNIGQRFHGRAMLYTRK